MPDFKLTADEITALTSFMLDRVREVPDWQEAEGTGPDAKPADASRGREKLLSLGCLACHTLDGSQDQSTAPSLESLSLADWTRGCLAHEPSQQRKAPIFDFTNTQRTALQAFARDGFPDALRNDPAAEFAERAYTSLRCNACHSRDTETDRLTQLAAATPRTQNIYDDEESSTGGSVHLGRPLLTFAGEKLYAHWMQRFIDGTLPYKPRPELQGRMPAFVPFAAGLAEGLAHQHGYPAESAPRPEVDLELAEIGRRLTLVDTGFSCVTCHNVGTQRALAGKDTATVSFNSVGERLRPSYYWRYVRDPVRLVPSTMMPRFINDDGTTPIKSVFDGDPAKQFDAIWHYLLSLRPTREE